MCRSSRARNCPARWKTATTSDRSSRTCANQARSSRTPTWCCSCSARNITSATRSRGRAPTTTSSGKPRWMRPTARPRSSSASNVMAPPAPSTCSSTPPSPASTIWRATIRRSSTRSGRGARNAAALDGSRRAGHNPLMSIQDAPLGPGQAPPGSDPAATGGLLTIDLAAIEANWRTLSGRTVPIECASVVKADAYGCGLELVTAKLAKAGCKTFFVADIAEGRQVRAIAREAVIYVLDGLLPNTAQAFASAELRPVINGPAELAEWDQFVTAATTWRGGAALHVDTGMNRLGLSP